MIIPPRITQLRFPRPPHAFLKAPHRRGPPLPIELEISTIARIPLSIITNAPFTHDRWPVAACIVITCSTQVPLLRCVRGLAIRPLQIAVVVVGHVPEIGEVLVWVPAAPGLVHDENVEEVVLLDWDGVGGWIGEGCFDGADFGVGSAGWAAVLVLRRHVERGPG